MKLLLQDVSVVIIPVDEETDLKYRVVLSSPLDNVRVFFCKSESFELSNTVFCIAAAICCSLSCGEGREGSETSSLI